MDQRLMCGVPELSSTSCSVVFLRSGQVKAALVHAKKLYMQIKSN